MSIFSINEHYQLLKIFEVFEKTAIHNFTWKGKHLGVKIYSQKYPSQIVLSLRK